jgi:mycothiol synthase
VRSVWAWPRFDLDRDAWVAIAPGGGLIGYAWIWGPRLPHGQFDASLSMRPGPQAAAIAGGLLSRVEARARTAAIEAALAAAALAIPCATVNHAKRDLLLERGFARARSYFRMERPLVGDLALPRWPAGIDVRPVLPGLDDADLHGTLQDAFSDHYRFMSEPLDEWVQRNLARADFAPELSFVARNQGAAVAAVTNYVTGDQAWVGMVGVRPAWRQRGLASALLLQSFHVFRERGLKTAGLGVDSANAYGATRVYERLGMKVTQQHDLFEKTLRPVTP